MSARDVFHESVKSALLKDNWVITHDPLKLKFSKDDRLRIDLGAEQLLVAERGLQKIAVEVKSFLSESAMFDFHLALGQFLNYRLALRSLEPDRSLYLAVPIAAYNSFFSRALPQAAIAEYDLKLLVYDPTNEVIVEWID
ncbi:MAG TPA: fatty-acid oxidation protein subunit alpha [Microcoleaceae bacterium UBA11344]|jgi:XisH protein.|nr:fatty-acid oxidation protein subunit alpha [Microcoleaceae cyanobacterium UBA11344]